MEIVKDVTIEIIFYHRSLAEELFCQAHQVLAGFSQIDPFSLYINKFDFELKL